MQLVLVAIGGSGCRAAGGGRSDAAPRSAEVGAGFANIAQTIPSLALFGFLVPLVGIGKTTAIIALCLYALLPILRNTLTGILGVDRAAVANRRSRWG